ncbi:MAG: TonB-dependent receptor [Fidelibacterota bacterium]|nr:MAG: TonB-dependent receptor [Candidatus Neomarinimicrobiota bacterium]
MRTVSIPIFIACLAFPLVLSAGITGKVAGQVLDAETQTPLMGANIQLVNTPLGAATDNRGNFVILNVPPGTYSVRISYIGYADAVHQEVEVNVDLTTSLLVTMERTIIEGQEVIITAQEKMIRQDVTSTLAVVRQEEIDNLPISDFTEALTLQAGVVGEGSQINIRGGRSNEVAYLIDGMHVQDPLLGGLATEVSNDAIKEMSLLSGTFNAEYGNSLSGVVNIITREGGEQLQGRVEYRTSQFGVKRYADLEEMRVNAFVGGPLLTDWLRFIVAGEIDNRGSYLPFGFRKAESFMSKLTFAGIPAIKMNLLYRASRARRQGYSHRWKYIPHRYTQRHTTSDQLALTMSHTLGNRFFYDMRLSYFQQTYKSGIYIDSIEAFQDTADYMTTGARTWVRDAGNGIEFYSAADPQQYWQNSTHYTEFHAGFVWQVGRRNEVKFGLQYKQHFLKMLDVYDPARDHPYIDDYTTRPSEGGAYIQDKIEFPFLVINLGLRYDYLNANAEFRIDPLGPDTVKANPRSQLSPRLGISHPISDRTKIHFAYGHFFQNPEFEDLYENSAYDLDVREPLFGQPSLDAERTVAYEVGLAHQFSERVAMHLTVYNKDVTGLIGTRYYAAYTDEAPDRYVGYTLIINEDYANIKGFEVRLKVRPGGLFSGGLSYTYQVAKGSASSEMEQYPGTSESSKLYYLDFDKPHIFNTYGVFELREGQGPLVLGYPVLQNSDLSFVIRASSGYPYTPSGRDIGFVDRNSLRMPSTYTIDLEVGKEFAFGRWVRGRVFAEILNLTDHRNIRYVYPDTGDPEYTTVGIRSEEYMKDPSNFGPPRVIRIGLGWEL